MAQPKNAAQIAPGAEMEGRPIDEPYTGYNPGVHNGVETLNGAFQDGYEYGLY